MAEERNTEEGASTDAAATAEEAPAVPAVTDQTDDYETDVPVTFQLDQDASQTPTSSCIPIPHSHGPHTHRCLPRRQVYSRTCTSLLSEKRLLVNGASIEQRPWKPTKRRGPEVVVVGSPGPATVALPGLVGPNIADAKKRSGPAYTFGLKHRKWEITLGPGPAQYNICGFANKGKNTAPAATMKDRWPERCIYQTPAPGTYDVDENNYSHKYSFGIKHGLKKQDELPGPNIYKVPTLIGGSKENHIPSAPAYTLTGRPKPRRFEVPLPGPGAYDPNFFTSRRKPPMFSIRPKILPPDDGAFKPGPGAHCPEMYNAAKSSPAISLGIRHKTGVRKQCTFTPPDRATYCLVPRQEDRVDTSRKPYC